MTTTAWTKLSLGLIAAAAALGSLSAPAYAAPRAGHSAALASPLAQPRGQIIDGVLWKCAGESCAAPASGSRPVTVCERVAKTFGPVARFSTAAGDLSADELTRCNGGK